MFYKYSTVFCLFFFLLGFSGLLFGNAISYKLSTQFPDSAPYFIGTKIVDLNITFLDTANNKVVLAIDPLQVKIGTKMYFLPKGNENEYHLKNVLITEELVKDKKLTIKVVSPLGPSYANTVQTYTLKDLNEEIGLSNNPVEVYNKLTIGQSLDITLNFTDLTKDNITKLSCFLGSYNSDFSFECDVKKNICSYPITVTEDLKELVIYCVFDKTVQKKTKQIPLYINIKPELSEGIVIKEFTNPVDGVIENPFKICFLATYTNKMTVVDDFTLTIDGKETDYTFEDSGDFCFSYFLIPYATFDKNITFGFNGKEYPSTTSVPLKPGLIWSIFLLAVGAFILLNLVLLLRSFLHKESMDDLIQKRETYQRKLKNAREDYLNGDIEKREFEDKNKEYTVKISLLNEKILVMKRAEKKAPKAKRGEFGEIEEREEIEGEEVEKGELEVEPEKKQKKASKELLSILTEEEGEEPAKVSREEGIKEIETEEISEEKTKELMETAEKFIIPEPKERGQSFLSKIFVSIKNVFKRKEKKKTEESSQPLETTKTDFEELGISKNEEDFDVKKWMKN